MGALSGLSGLSGLSAVAGGFAPAPGYEYQTILFTVSGSPAPAVYGKLAATWRGNTATLDMTSGLPAPATALGTFESIWGSGNVEAAAVSKGYRLKFVGDLAEFDIEEATLTPSTSYTLNDGSGTAPTKTSQRDYAAGSSGTAEQFTISLFNPPTDGSVVLMSGKSVDVSGGVISNVAPGIGFSVTAGGVGFQFVTITADSPGPQTDESIMSDTTGGASVNTDVQGTAGSAEVLGQCVINFTGAAGWATFADGFTALAFSVTATGDAIKSLLNGASGYNDTIVDTVTVGASTITIDYASGKSPAGTITIGGKTGAAVTAEIDTIQDGATTWTPLEIASLEAWLDPSLSYTDTGTTLAVDNDAVRQTNDLGPHATHDGQSNASFRPLKKTVSGKPRLLYDGSDDRSTASVAAYQTSTTVVVYQYAAHSAGTYRVAMAYGANGSGGGNVIWHGQNDVDKIGISNSGPDCINGDMDTAQHISVSQRTPTTFAGFLDGAQIDTTKGQSGTQATGLITGMYAGNQFPANVYIGDRFVFSSILTAAETGWLLHFLADR